MKNGTKRSTILFLSFSLLSCAVQRPDTDLCGVNGGRGYLRCFNLLRDYDDNGNRRADATPTTRPISKITDLNGYTCTDADGLANLKAFVAEMREQLRECSR